MKSITVFCGSSAGNDPIYSALAAELGKVLAQRGIDVVYGGARVGLMGSLADGALTQGGRVIGVLPRFLKAKEIAHERLTEMVFVDTMHERKIRMHEMSDGVIALPGGYGTMEEFFEIMTWAQLGLHQKPMGMLNIQGFYNPLVTMIDSMVHEGFLKKVNRNMLLVSENIDTLLSMMDAYAPPIVDKWIDNRKI